MSKAIIETKPEYYDKKNTYLPDSSFLYFSLRRIVFNISLLMALTSKEQMQPALIFISQHQPKGYPTSKRVKKIVMKYKSIMTILMD